MQLNVNNTDDDIDLFNKYKKANSNSKLNQYTYNDIYPYNRNKSKKNLQDNKVLF